MLDAVRTQQEGTTCKPMLVLLQCAKDGHCSGIGDRVKGLQTAFWMVRFICLGVC